MCVCVFLAALVQRVVKKQTERMVSERVRSGLWVSCCGHGVSEWEQKSKQIGRKSIENRSKIDENLVSGRLGTILVAVCAKVGSRTLRPAPPGNEKSFFKRKWCPKCAFLEIPKIENGTKTDQLPLRGHFDPLKMLFLEGSEKT